MTTAPANSIEVEIRFGEGFTPTDRIAAALNELHAALTEADAEVGGFAMDYFLEISNVKADPRWPAKEPLSFSWGLTQTIR